MEPGICRWCEKNFDWAGIMVAIPPNLNTTNKPLIHLYCSGQCLMETYHAVGEAANAVPTE